MAKELLPSEYEDMVRTGKAGRSDTNKYFKPGLITAGVLVLCGLSFGLGVSYQKGKMPAAVTASDNSQVALDGQFGPRGMSGGGPGGFGDGQRPNVGEVTAVTSGSITIRNTRTGSDETFKLTSNTSVMNAGSVGSISDIKSGDTVFIQTDSKDTTVATQIVLNLNMGRPQGGGAPQNTEENEETEVEAQTT